MKITFNPYDYNSKIINQRINALYKKVFQYDFSDYFDWWYLNNPNGKSIGVVAYDCEKVIGHFAVSPIKMNIKGHISKQLISLAAMVDADYQGMGIFKKLGKELFNHLIDNTNYDFIIAFPNDNSLKVHLGALNYNFIRDYNFVVFERTDEKDKNCYEMLDSYDINEILHDKIHLNRSEEYVKWRYGNKKKYQIIKDDKGNEFVVSKFKNKIDILLWNSNLEINDLKKFIQYLYRSFNVDDVSTWNTLDVFNELGRCDPRGYHFCVRFLNNEMSEKELLRDKTNWVFMMGDCELF